MIEESKEDGAVLLHRPLLLRIETNDSRLEEEDNFPLVPPMACCCRVNYVRDFLADSCFLLGSFLAVIFSSLDLHDAWIDAGRDDNGQQNNDDTREIDPLEYWDTNKIGMSLSTCLYLLDSSIHILSFSKTIYNRNDIPINVQTDGNQYHAEGYDLMADNNGTDRNIGHQQDLSREIETSTSQWCFAVVFGFAALLDLLSSLTEDESMPLPSYVLGAACVDLFWISAVVTVYSKREFYRPFCCKSSEGNVTSQNFNRCRLLLLFFGDMFFLMGCTVDVIVNLADNPVHEVRWMWLAIGNVVSSFFWFTDAIIYQLVDVDIFDSGLASVRNAQVLHFDGPVFPEAASEEDNNEGSQ